MNKCVLYLSLFLGSIQLTPIYNLMADPLEYRSSSCVSLENGIRVVFVDTTYNDSLLVMLGVSAGSTDEKEIDGVSNLLVKAVVNKLNETPNINGVQYGEAQSYAGYDQSIYYYYGKKDDLEGFITKLGTVFSKLSFSDQELNNCKKAIEQKIISRDQVDRHVLQKESRQALYWHSKYGSSIEGDLDDLNNISASDLENFKNENYTLDRTVIVIAGNNINKERTLESIKKYFGIKKTESKINRLEEPDHHGSTSCIIKYSSQVQAPIINMSWRLPTYRKNPDKCRGIEIFINYLNDTLQHSNIAEGINISWSYIIWNHDYGELSVMLSLTPDLSNSVEYIKNAIILQIKKIVSEGITKEDADKVVKSLVGASNFSGRDAFEVVDWMFKKLSAFYDFEFVRGYPTFIRKYDLQNINKEAKVIFENGPEVVSILLPESLKNHRGKDESRKIPFSISF